MTRKSALPLAALLAGALVLGGCATNQPGPKQGVGTILGAIGGGIAGAQFGHGKGRLVATAIGTLGGAVLGNAVGQSLDRADATYAAQAQQAALERYPSGETIEWQNPDSGHYGSVTPLRTYRSDGRYCREYTQTVWIGGRQSEAYGEACRQPDGSWQIRQ
ncbi:RT0821/Lpp0805 family surface protein [Oceanibacterium hippocampi]|uniref:Surface antigen domain-containing protein n=1 Tax=Oceanibacterium hippocampi TaxID=745714 RepID=A0A1Y5TB78_9PROT|nr:RT0821/Lpp0805 family surface protein [Oceanibacterium hippocampi]SLN59890.1 hypothetical protein OCH7691_02638 [Oceanibacterium hippocampi]